MQAFLPSLASSLGLFLPLTDNALGMGRAEAYLRYGDRFRILVL